MRKNLNRVAGLGLIVWTVLSSCDAPVQKENVDASSAMKQYFLETNQYMRERHKELIQAFLSRVGWDMKETSSGLWYRIEEKGSGQRVEGNLFVTYTYTTRLLNGTFCYSAGEEDPKKIVPDKTDIEKGLLEGLELLREGSRATFILPPYLAHGNFGDRDKIPGSAILLIQVHVLDVKR